MKRREVGEKETNEEEDDKKAGWGRGMGGSRNERGGRTGTR